MTQDKWSRWLQDERWTEQRGAQRVALNRVRDRILGLAQIRPGERVVDLGAGTGLLGLQAAELVCPAGAVVFLDISAPALRLAQTAAAVGCERFLVGDAASLPLRDACANLVMTRSVLCYVRERYLAAREIARVLRRGGRAVVHEPVNRKMALAVDLPEFADATEAFQRALDLNPLTDFDENDLVSTFREAGFSSVRLEMDESRWPARGKEWAQILRYGAPAGYSGYDMLIMGGLSRERADEFLVAGERHLGEGWRMETCPVAVLLATR